jgi:hypothetical protein
VLRKGLAGARKRENIAADMAYILRDERRYEESVEAFTIAIEEGDATSGVNKYYCMEREALLKKIGAPQLRAPIAGE